MDRVTFVSQNQKNSRVIWNSIAKLLQVPHSCHCQGETLAILTQGFTILLMTHFFLGWCDPLHRSGLPGIHIRMCCYQGVALFERIKGIRRRGPFGGSVPLQVGVEVSKAHAKPPVSPSAYGSGYSSQLLSQCLHACYNASCHGDNWLNLWSCKQLN